MTRKRRILIAALLLAAVGIRLVLLERSSASNALFRFLARHPTARAVVQYAYYVTGNEAAFATGMYNVAVVDGVPVE